jgi:hypothetical protein
MNCDLKVYVIAGFSRGVNEILALVGCYLTSQENEDLRLYL